MKREVKFRGVSEYDNKIVFGLPKYLIEENADDGVIDGIVDSCGVSIDVLPETVGESTNEIDINRKEIFEGDLVKVGEYYDGDHLQKEFVGTVVFEDACFSVQDDSNNYEQLCCIQINDYKMEVVGNIHQK